MKTSSLIKHNCVTKIILTLASIIAVSSAFCDKQDECGDFMICLNNECICDESSETFSDFEDYNNQNPNYQTACRKSAQIGELCDNRTTICMTDSVCNSEGICKCPGDLEETKISKECRRPYDYPCNETQLCNPEKFLSCRRDDDLTGKRICRCHNEQEMTFDPLKNSCVGRIGQMCELREWMGLQLGCGKNSHCSKADPLEEFYGVCKCNSGFVQVDPSTKCESLYGKPCLAFPEPDCADGFNLECVQNTCQCKSGSVFNQKEQACKLIHGAGCEEAENECVQNAKCRLNYGPEWKLACQCSQEFMATSTGHCQLGHEESNCSVGIKCHSESGLKCLNDTCQCNTGLVFDPLSKACTAVHGSSCSLKKPNCVMHSVCNENSLCECKDTFKATEEGYCEASYGAICSLEDDDVTDTNICPLEIGLSCQHRPNQNQHHNMTESSVGTRNKTGMCSCVDAHTRFDKVAGRCLRPLGEHCSPPSKRCMTNAFCGTNQNCQCYSEYSPTPDGYCLLDFLQPCKTSSVSCNMYLGLECINQTCNCSSATVYNQTLKRCVNIPNESDDQKLINTSLIISKRENATDKNNPKSPFNEDENDIDHPKRALNPQKPVLSGILTFTLMVIFVVLIFAVILNSRIQRKYYCLTSHI